MLRRVLLSAMFLLLGSAAVPAARAQAPAATPLPADPLATPLAEQARADFARRQPLAAELQAVLDEQRERLRVLRAELAVTREARRALELQRAIAAAKRETEVRLLRAQAAHARAAGRFGAADTLEAAIRALSSPAEAREPQARPAPRVER